MVQGFSDDQIVLGGHGVCEQVRTMGAPPPRPQVLPRRSSPHGVARGQVTAGFVPVLALTLALRALVLWVPAACLYAEAYLCPPLLSAA